MSTRDEFAEKVHVACWWALNRGYPFIYCSSVRKDFVLRTLNQHLDICDEIEIDQDASREYGVTELQYFDICNGGLVPDIMHVLEGVLQYETKLVLIHMTQTCHYLTIKHLNHLITSVNRLHGGIKSFH